MLASREFCADTQFQTHLEFLIAKTGKKHPYNFAISQHKNGPLYAN